jgi:hypothetical protein
VQVFEVVGHGVGRVLVSAGAVSAIAPTGPLLPGLSAAQARRHSLGYADPLDWYGVARLGARCIARAIGTPQTKLEGTYVCSYDGSSIVDQGFFVLRKPH